MQCLLNRARLHLKWLQQKVMDVIARQPDFDGQAADALSAVYLGGGCSQIAQNSNNRMSWCVDTSSTPQVAKIMDEHSRTSGPTCKKCVRTSTCWSFMGNTIWRNSIAARMEKVQSWECLCVHRKQGLFLSVSSFNFNMWQIVHHIDIDFCTLTLSLSCRCLPCCFILLQHIHRQTQLSCTTLILTRARTWIEQALSFILSLRNKNGSHCHLDIIHGSGASPLRPPVY